jgi:nitroreductase
VFDDEEAVAVVVGLRAAAGTMIAGIEETAVRALAKVEQSLPDRLRRRVSALDQSVVSLQRAHGSDATVDPASLSLLASACRNREEVRFEYRPSDGDLSDRLVEPHQLLSAGNFWYLIAWDLRRDDWRTFRLDRLRNVRLAGRRFAPRAIPGGDAAAHLTASVASMSRQREERPLGLRRGGPSAAAPARRGATWDHHAMHPTDAFDLYEGLVTTRAIRRYRAEDIPDEDLNKILFAATRGPSGHNTQPFRFLVLRRNRETAEARQLLAEGFRTAWAPNRVEPADDDHSRRARMARTMNHFVDTIADAPVIVLACFRSQGQRNDISAGASVYPACQNLLLAARALGYGGVMTQWHRPVVDRLEPALGLPDDVSIVNTIPLGRPVGSHGPVRRLPLQDLVYEGRYGQPASWAQDPAGTRYTGG